MPADTPTHDFVDTMRLTRSQYMALLASLAHRGGPAHAALSPENHRRQQRIPFHHDARLLCEFRADADADADDASSGAAEPALYLVKCRNISAGGMGFLHGGPLAIGTACEMTLLRADRTTLKLRGVVARCECIERHIFEIGVRFEKDIDLNKLMAIARGSDVAA